MLSMPRIPELAQRDRFVRRAVKEGRVLTLADEENASVASQKHAGRTVQLFWSSPIEAKRWAEALTGDGGLQDITLAAFASEILPGIGAAKGLAGVDWVADPIEAEVDPADLILRLKFEAISTLLTNFAARGQVYVVAGEDGPLVETHATRQGDIQRVQIFSTRQDADRHAKRSGGRSVTADPLADFRSSTLPWAAARGYLVTVEPISGAGGLDIAADDLERRLKHL